MRRIGIAERVRIHARSIWFHKVVAPRYYSKIRPSDIVIDCGAHIGDITQCFFDRGAIVHAFEPHPNVDFIVVETHERSMGMKPKHAALQAKIAKNRIFNIDLNWL